MQHEMDRPRRMPASALPHPGLTLLGLAVLLLWGTWWFASFERGVLRGARHTWVPAWEFLGLDFLNNYHASRHWLAGGHPFQEPFGDPNGRQFCYPPVVLLLFTWCQWLTAKKAVFVWTLVLAGMAGAGAFAAWRTRQALGLWHAPLPLALAAVLCAAPVIFAMERGNYDLLVVLLLVVAAWALRGVSAWRDGLAGLALALAACIKVYPLFVVPALLVLRRPRALVCCVVAGLGMAAFEYGNLPHFLANTKAMIARNYPEAAGRIHLTVHTLSGCWKLLLEDTLLAPLARVPGTLAAFALVLPVMAWVSYRLYRCAAPRDLVYPYLLWLAAAATFLPVLSNDYNLVFLPIAAVAIWDRRDPVLTHVLMGLMGLWWQPVQIAIGPKMLVLFKFVGLVAVAVSLVTRAREQAEATSPLAVSPTAETALPSAA